MQTHTLMTTAQCRCKNDTYCPICDGGLAYCVVCKGGELDLVEQSCVERLREQGKGTCPICRKEIEVPFERLDINDRAWCKPCGEDFDNIDHDATN